MENPSRRRGRERVSVADGGRTSILLVATLVLAVAFSYRIPWRGSFWVDEAISAWIVRDGISEVWHRSIAYQGQSPLYYSLLWIVVSLLGRSELALRAPSILLGVVSIFLVYELGRALTNRRDSALMGAAIFLSTDGVLRAVVGARPYALALGGALVSLLLIERLVNRPTYRGAILFSFSLLGVFYSHYLFIVVALPHLLTLLRYRVAPRLIATVVAVFAMGAWPGLYQLRSLALRAPELSFAANPTPLAFLQGAMPLPTVVAVLVALALGLIWQGEKRDERINARGISFLAPYVILAPLLFAIFGSFSGTSLWVSRYWCWQLAPLSIICAIALSKIPSGRGRKVACVALYVALLSRAVSQAWIVEDWRGAVATISDGTGKIVLYDGLIEAEQVSDSERGREEQEYLAAPLLVYGVTRPVVTVGVTAPEAILARSLEEASALVAIRSRRGAHYSPERFLNVGEARALAMKEVFSSGLISVFQIERK